MERQGQHWGAQFNVVEAQHRIAQMAVTPPKEPQLRNRTNGDATKC